MSKRTMLIVGAVVVLVAAGALWFAFGRGAGAPQGAATNTPPSATATDLPTGEDTESVEASGSTESSVSVDAAVNDPIPVEGVHEKAMLAAVPAAIKDATAKKKAIGAKMPDVSGASPILTSYGIIARIENRMYLFQVFKSGAAYEYLRYPTRPDPKSQYFLDAAGFAQEPLVDPVGDREKAAVAAVQKLMSTAFPKDKPKVQVWNYSFAFKGKDGKLVSVPGGGVFGITLSTKGTLTGME